MRIKKTDIVLFLGEDNLVFFDGQQKAFVTKELKKIGGVQYAVFLPVKAALPFVNLRNHRKIAVIDGRLAYVGSQNIVDRDFRRGIVNDELVARVTALPMAITPPDTAPHTSPQRMPWPKPEAMDRAVASSMPQS